MRGNENEEVKKRKEELLACFNNVDEGKKNLILPMIDEFVHLEQELKKLRDLPHIRIHPKNPAKQEVTPAGKLYKDYMQSYINALKVLQKTISADNENGESPLVKMLKEFR